MTYPSFRFSPRFFFILLVALPTLAAAQKSGVPDPNIGGLLANVVLEDSFDDVTATQTTWGIDTGGTWTDHFTDDGSGGYALLFFDVDDNGGGQDGNPNSGASFPPPLQSGGGGFGTEVLTYYDEGSFQFDMAIDTRPALARSPRVQIFTLDAGLKIEMVYDAGVWSYRLLEGINTATDWVQLPVGTTAANVKITFVAGGSHQIGIFEVQWRVPGPGGFVWVHSSRVQSLSFPDWSRFFLGLKTPADEHFVPPPLPTTYNDEWLYSIAYDNFQAFSSATSISGL